MRKLLNLAGVTIGIDNTSGQLDTVEGYDVREHTYGLSAAYPPSHKHQHLCQLL